MKSFTAAMILGLTVAATAAPSSRLLASKRQTPDLCLVNTRTNPSATDVENAINQWNNDVNGVNNFLNEVGGVTDPVQLQMMTDVALAFAQDEPCQFATLQSIPGFAGQSLTPAFDCANADLSAVFKPHVITNLMTIIANPSDSVGVAAAVQDIQNFRCCNVLPDADILWRDSAEENNISNSVNTVAGRPDECASIDCTPACAGDSNGIFGK